MKELIVYFSENRIDAYYLQKSGGSVNILDYHRYKDDETFVTFLKKLKIRHGKAVIEDRETVVKGVTSPLLYSEDVEDFVSNNINEYFVLDSNNFEVDYRITSQNKKERALHLMLTAVKKEQLEKVKSFFSRHSIKLSSLTVMPDIVMNIIQKEEKKSVALIRVQGNSAWVHIEREKNMFLHTAFEYEDEDGIPTEGTLENIGYYLNFYSKQNFGETIEKVIVQTEKRYEVGLKESLRAIYDGEIAMQNLPQFQTTDSSLTGSVDPEEAWLLGVYPSGKTLYNKQINYAQKRGQFVHENRKKSVFTLGIVLLLVTALIQGGFFLLENYMKSFYNTELVQVPEERVVEVNEALREVTLYEKGLMDKAEVLENISKENTDYMEYLTVLQAGLPREAKISSIYIHNAGIDVDFHFTVEASRTLDAARVVLVLNDTDLFEPVKLSSLNMDNTQENLQLNLTYKIQESESPEEADGESEGGSDGL